MTRGLDTGLIHSCTIKRKSQDQKLSFTLGSIIFTVSRIVQGASSHATGTIKSVTLNSGSWAGGTAAGYLILSGASGTFTAGEAITETTGTIKGTAQASGAATLEFNEVGTPVYTETSTIYTDSCRFFNSSGTLQDSSGGWFRVSVPSIFLPSTAIVQEGDSITGIAQGFAHTYTVFFVNTIPEFNSSDIDHIEAQLKVVEKEAAV